MLCTHFFMFLFSLICHSRENEQQFVSFPTSEQKRSSEEEQKLYKCIFPINKAKHRSNTSAGNNFSLFAGHMSFQIFLLVGHSTNWTGHNLLTDNTLKKRTQDVLVRCSVIVSDHYVKLAGHFQNLVGQCPMSDCYFQH